MPVHAGIHGFLADAVPSSWMAAFAARTIDLFAAFHYGSC